MGVAIFFSRKKHHIHISAEKFVSEDIESREEVNSKGVGSLGITIYSTGDN